MRRISWGLVGVVLLSCGSSLFAQTATITLTGVGNANVYDNVYVSPYTATVNGVVNTTVICDDFYDETYFNESWTANVSTVASLGSVLWDPSTSTPAAPPPLTAQQVLYEEMAYLAYALETPGITTATQDAISFAIWDLSDPSAVSSYLGSTGLPTGTAYWMTQAENNYGTLSEAQLADVLVLTPNKSDAITCGGGTCPTAPPQEFLEIVTSAPEPTTFAELGLDMGGLVFLVVFLRRRISSRQR
jgi:hypothetical protein